MVTSMVGLSVWCLWVWRAVVCSLYAWLSPPCFLLYQFGVFGYGRLVYTKYGWVIGLVFMGMEGSANELIVKQRGAPTTQTGTLQRSSAKPR